MKPVIRNWFFALAILLWSIAAPAETTPELEALEPGTALSAVKASSGVVFVDLYAEW